LDIKQTKEWRLIVPIPLLDDYLACVASVSEGFCGAPPYFISGSIPTSRAGRTKNPVLCSQTPGKRLLGRLMTIANSHLVAQPIKMKDLH